MVKRKKPDISHPLHVGRPNIGSRAHFVKYMEEIFDRVWLTNNGPFVQQFEQKIADFLGVKHCIATCNGTLALELAIRALGIQGEVILPSFTFIATAHALQWQGIQPVFCDIDPQSCCIDSEKIAQHITAKTSGIIGVHLYGRPAAITALQAIADEYKLKLLFDAAHAFGCSYQGEMIGSFGECEIFSFHATKVFNTFEGGAITTNNDELAQRIRLMKNFGFAGEDRVTYIGTNGKMTEISAAMGLVNFDSFDEFVDVNRKHWDSYHNGLENIPGLSLMLYDKAEKNNYQYVVLKIDSREFGMTRDALKSKLEKNNIFARRYFYPGCHRMEPYVSLYPEADRLLGETEAFGKQVLILPTGFQARTEQIRSICTLMQTIHAENKQSL